MQKTEQKTEQQAGLGMSFCEEEGRITVFRKTLEALEWPAHYRFLYNRKMKQIAVQACGAEEAGAHRVGKLDESKGDYLFPNLAVQDEPQIIGKYGMLRRTYLKENRKNWYQSMLMSGRLNQHLAQIEEEAENRMETLLDGLNERFPAPSKEKDPLAWAAHQNSLTAMAEEIVLKELVYN